MSARYVIACLTVAALVAGGAGRTNAKPPDLPIHLKVICLTEAEGPSRASPAGDENVESEDPSALTPDQYTCPYLRQKAMEKQHPQVEPAEPATLLENLEKLEQAEKILREGERYDRQGKPELARDCYERVQQLCPGSRYDRTATARLRKLPADFFSGFDPGPSGACRDKAKAAGSSCDGHADVYHDLPWVDPKIVEGVEEMLLDEIGDQLRPESAAELEGTLEGVVGVIGLFQGGACLEIDNSRFHRLRAQCAIAAGGLMIRFVADEGTLGQCCIVRFLPSPLGDVCTPSLSHQDVKRKRRRCRDAGAVGDAAGKDGRSDGCKTADDR
ncbi:MAG TPA: hypothetical protein VG013_12515 [Gemmataceae bacterium]|jgi:hypothetical protein|nr:hypothetical protein [Gemmataceae bacterium]